eukprot:3941767-Rhodomonas_salina.1
MKVWHPTQSEPSKEINLGFLFSTKRTATQSHGKQPSNQPSNQPRSKMTTAQEFDCYMINCTLALDMTLREVLELSAAKQLTVSNKLAAISKRAKRIVERAKKKTKSVRPSSRGITKTTQKKSGTAPSASGGGVVKKEPSSSTSGSAASGSAASSPDYCSSPSS